MNPTPAPNHFPYVGHRNLAQVDHDEARGKFLRLPNEKRVGQTVRVYREAGA